MTNIKVNYTLQANGFPIKNPILIEYFKRDGMSSEIEFDGSLYDAEALAKLLMNDETINSVEISTRVDLITVRRM